MANPNRTSCAFKLVVCVVTYNHESCIEDCLDTLLDQETNFKYHILILDDFSTDKTADIIQAKMTTHPGKITLLRNPQNMGALYTFRHVHTLAQDIKPDFIAHIDGDDMAAPGKLQAQVDRLDHYPDVAMSAHRVVVLGQDRTMPARTSAPPEFGDLNDLMIHGSYFVNSSTMYRANNGLAPLSQPDLVDFFAQVHHASLGKIHFDSRVFGAYRWHGGGISKRADYVARIESTYNAAFDLAIARGADPVLVRRSQLSRRKSFAIAALVSNDTVGFTQRIKLKSTDRPFASRNHKLLSSFRKFIRGPVASFLVKRYQGSI